MVYKSLLCLNVTVSSKCAQVLRRKTVFDLKTLVPPLVLELTGHKLDR